jgi:hypothetical protein
MEKVGFQIMHDTRVVFASLLAASEKGHYDQEDIIPNDSVYVQSSVEERLPMSVLSILSIISPSAKHLT